MIELYIWHSCPFCQKVLKAVNTMGLEEGKDYTVIDSGPGTVGRMTVQQRGGKSMVPFLIDGEMTMYESDDIITYLKESFIA
jgi:glutathione S-transferase